MRNHQIGGLLHLHHKAQEVVGSEHHMAMGMIPAEDPLAGVAAGGLLHRLLGLLQEGQQLGTRTG